MNAQANSLPLPAIEAVQGTLDERIAQAEQRLVAREQGLRSGWQALTRRAQRATEPRRLVWPVLGVAAALLAAVWLLRRRAGVGMGALAGAVASSASSATFAARTPKPGAARWSELPWVRGTALVWPLLPAHWRARFSPGTASLMVAVGLPLIEQLFKRRVSPALPAR
jgi:hypothetical protein